MPGHELGSWERWLRKLLGPGRYWRWIGWRRGRLPDYGFPPLRPEQDTKGGEHIVCCGSCYLTVKREWKCLECERMVPAEEVIKLLPGGGIRVAPREVLEKCERVTL